MRKLTLFSLALLGVILSSCGASLDSAETTGSVGPVEGVSALAGDSQITIQWQAMPVGTCYNLYMAEKPGVTKDNYSKLSGGVKFTHVTSPFVVSNGITNGTAYYFVVAAYECSEDLSSSEMYTTPNSSVGNKVSSAILFTAQSAMTVTPGNGQVTITWPPVNNPALCDYNIYMATTPGVTPTNYGSKYSIPVTYPQPSSYSHLISPLTNGTTYYFVFSHRHAPGGNCGGEQVSKEVSAIPLPAERFAYVTNAGNDTVSIINTTNNAVVATVPVGDIPLGVAVDAPANRVYIATPGGVYNGTVSVIDMAGNPVTTVSVAMSGVDSSPIEVAVDRTTRKVYVVHSSTNWVSIIDPNNNYSVTQVNVGGLLEGVAVDWTVGRAYVANRGDDTVSVISTTSNTVVATVAVGDNPVGVAVHPSINRAYVVNTNDNTVSVINTADNTVVTTVSMGAPPQLGAPPEAEAVAVDVIANKVYVANRTSSLLFVIDALTNVLVGSPVSLLPFGGPSMLILPMGLAVDPTTSKVFATFGDNTVVVIDTTSNNLVTSVSVGSRASRVAVGLW